jgi:hypothetical protein
MNVKPIEVEFPKRWAAFMQRRVHPQLLFAAVPGLAIIRADMPGVQACSAHVGSVDMRSRAPGMGAVPEPQP